MEIVIIGGTPKEDLEAYFYKNIKPDKNNLISIFPEYTMSINRPVHPQEILEYVESEAKECIKNNKSYYLITFCDHALNGVRIAYKKSKGDFFVTCHQIFNCGKATIATIQKDGRLSCWQKGVWDTWDDALLEIL